MDVCCDCCVLSVKGLGVGVITRPEDAYRVFVWIRSWRLDKEEALAHLRLSRHVKKKLSCTPLSFPLFISTCFIVLLFNLNVLQLLHHFYYLHPLFLFSLCPCQRAGILNKQKSQGHSHHPIAVFALTNGVAAVAAASGPEHVPSHGWRSVSAREYRPEQG